MENETKKEGTPQEEKGCCGFGHMHMGHKGMHSFCILRVAILLAILVAVFSIGLAFGREGEGRSGYKNGGYGERGGWGMMGGRGGKFYRNGNFGGCGLPGLNNPAGNTIPNSQTSTSTDQTKTTK